MVKGEGLGSARVKGCTPHPFDAVIGVGGTGERLARWQGNKVLASRSIDWVEKGQLSGLGSLKAVAARHTNLVKRWLLQLPF
jgi:hypothetical protein